MMHLIFVYNMDFNFAIVHHSTQKIVQQIACQWMVRALASFIGKVIEQVKFSTSILLWHPRILQQNNVHL
jgi:hypothetical protein